MATTMTKRGNIDNAIAYEHYCDTRADMDTIDPKYITLGSVCVVLADTGVEMFIADSKKEWHVV